MFVDKVQVTAKAGDGGNGIVSFRHEKYVDRGGPDGGDGGCGGNVVVTATRNQHTLAEFRYKKNIRAKNGETGSKRKKHGKAGQDTHLLVPVGTVITSHDGTVIADLNDDSQEVVLAKGGDGGFGNAHFTSSVRQAPRVAEKGEKGEEFTGTFELKMIADVGLVGLPNAGKSTLLSIVSNAKPEIANYPFTTLRPNLGIVDVGKEQAMLLADIPGLIEGASQGKGLGDEFLRHVERTSVLIHMIDIYNDDPAAAYNTIQQELQAYSKELAKKPQIIVITKIDGVDDEIVEDVIKQVKKHVPKKADILAISSKSSKNVDELIKKTHKKLTELQKKKPAKKLPVITLNEQESPLSISKEGKKFVVRGSKIERFAARTDFANPHGVDRLRDILHKLGVIKQLEDMEIDDGQIIQIGLDESQQISY